MMGGSGSTRWLFHSKKDTVEDCRVLSIFDLKRDGLLNSELVRFGTWTWCHKYTKEVRASIDYKLIPDDEKSLLRLQYLLTGWNGSKHDLDYTVVMETTPCHFGGVRWWFICPLTTNGRHCKRRAGKLYLPPGSRYFGCRHCYDLTYCSSQESDKRVNALKGLSPMAILDGINNGNIDLLMGLKALPDEIWR